MLAAVLLHNLDVYFDAFDITPIKLLRGSAWGAAEDHAEGPIRDNPNERPDDCYELQPPDYFHPHNSSRSPRATGVVKSKAEPQRQSP